ncbi:hypothetical protein IQ255_29690 [Pleurocapsales cyanobacterium LEGE 10410]|nr:hypothetical protein [Pleurocapsales cyanobacterium LEGE 10410]
MGRIKEARWFWYFILWPGLFYLIGYCFWGHITLTLHLMAYAIQFGAFSIIIFRLNSLYKHYHPHDWDYKKAIWECIKSIFRKRNPVVIKPENINQGQYLTQSDIINHLSDETLEEVKEWLNINIPALHNKIDSKTVDLDNRIHEFRDELIKKINKLRNQHDEEKKDTRELQLPNLERELVAVLWLMFAAFTFAYTNLIA